MAQATVSRLRCQHPPRTAAAALLMLLLDTGLPCAESIATMESDGTAALVRSDSGWRSLSPAGCAPDPEACLLRLPGDDQLDQWPFGCAMGLCWRLCLRERGRESKGVARSSCGTSIPLCCLTQLNPGYTTQYRYYCWSVRSLISSMAWARVYALCMALSPSTVDCSFASGSVSSFSSSTFLW